MANKLYCHSVKAIADQTTFCQCSIEAARQENGRGFAVVTRDQKVGRFGSLEDSFVKNIRCQDGGYMIIQ